MFYISVNFENAKKLYRTNLYFYTLLEVFKLLIPMFIETPWWLLKGVNSKL